MIDREQLNEFLDGIVMRDELGELVKAGQMEELNRKLVARLDVQQGQLDGLQSLMGAMQVKITQMQMEMVKMGEMLAAKENEIVAAREETLKAAQQKVEETAESVRNDEPVDKVEDIKPLEPVVKFRQQDLEEQAEESVCNTADNNEQQEDVVKEHAGTQTIADAIKGEESLAEKLSKRVDHETVASSINSSKIDRIQTAITIADRFRFQRELFAGDAVKMAETVEILNKMKNLDDALAYIDKMFNWDVDLPVVRDFLRIIERRF